MWFLRLVIKKILKGTQSPFVNAPVMASPRVLLLILILTIGGCEVKDKLSDFEPYTGPLRTLNNAVIIHTDSAKVQGKIITPVWYEFENEDRELPEGGFVEFYNEFGIITANLQAEYAYFTKESQEWRIEGDVILKNIENNESLNTEQLFWNPITGMVHTEKFVRIERVDEILTGTGLTAKQDFSSYIIKKPEGTFNLVE